MRIKKKYESGAAANYITRRKAMKKLQLNLKNFRRLCILKGIYPHEPLHRKKVNKGSTENHVYYYLKDIDYLASEPIISKFREYKIFLRKLTKAKAKRETDQVKRLYAKSPTYELQRIVKERYPKFETALRDLDDALCLTFAFACLPHTKIISATMIAECRRLTAEFNNFLIESHSLTKVFISIKGIYYQAQVKGERLTWVVSHERGVGRVTDVDFSVMTIFVEFYIALLESVNCHLYSLAGLYYPPKLAYTTVQDEEMDEDEKEKIYCLTTPLARQEVTGEDAMPDMSLEDEENHELAERFKNIETRKKLFANCWFWLNREAPKDVLTIIIRSCGGFVSWEDCPAAPFKENDSRITHQVVDRPVAQANISRCYIQPQWVVDCFNLRRRVPVERYLPEAILPPHLSPFASDAPGEYIPSERIEQLKESGIDVSGLPKEKEENGSKKNLKESRRTTSEMHVGVGKMHRKNPQKELNEKGHKQKLREMMILKKHRRVYNKIKRGIKRQNREIKALREKRERASTNV